MQENNFEKQVKQLMDDLRVNPSEPVWEYIEKRIPKSNRRRRFIAFFLLFIGLATCAYFFYNKDSLAGNLIANNNNNEALKPNNNTLHEQTVDAAKTEQPVSTDTVSRKPDAEKNTIAIASEKALKKTTSITNEHKIKNNTTEFTSTTTNETINSKENNKEESIANNEKQQSIKNETSKNEVIVNDEIKRSTATNEGINNVDSTVASTKTNLDTATSLKQNDAISAKKELKKPNNNYKKLQWGVSGFYGRSDIIEGIGIFSSDKSLAGGLSASPGANWDSVASLNYSKAIKAKSSFSLGIAVKKQVSKRSSISAGIQYTHISTQIKTGEIKDSSASFNYNNSNITTRLENFYRPGLSVSRINKYNLIQIPLLYSYQFATSKKLPLFINAGFSLTRIISSDALVYDSYNQAYYKNTNVFNKTQVTLTGGLHTNLSFIKHGTLEIGPQLQYGLTNIVKNNDAKQHLFFWGLNARYFIRNKK